MQWSRLWSELHENLAQRKQNSRKRRRRQLAERLVANVAPAEQRVLLSGVTAVDDSLVVSQAQGAAQVDVLANDAAGAQISGATDGAHGTVLILQSDPARGRNDSASSTRLPPAKLR